MTARHTHRRPSADGQAMVEFALILPLILALFLGTWTVSTLVAAQDQATTATRNGARLAAELGRGGWTPAAPSTDPTAVDGEIVKTVTASLTGPGAPSGVTIQEVDVYKPDPNQPFKDFCVKTNGNMLLDRYNADGTTYPSTTPDYKLNLRDDVLGSETDIGVRVVYTYKPPAGMFAWMGITRNACTVMQIQPQ